MKLIYEFLTIIVFFVAYKIWKIYVATASLMVLLSAKAIYSYLKYKKIDTVDLISLVVVLVAGGATLYFANPEFIKFKPTVINLFFAAALLMAHWFFNKNIFQILLGKQLQLPAPAWRKLLYIWVLFFIFMALLNAYVALYFSEDFWVNFKLWGFIFPLIAVAISGVVVAPYLKNLPSNNKEENSKHDL